MSFLLKERLLFQRENVIPRHRVSRLQNKGKLRQHCAKTPQCAGK